jgi:hypothetical protein
LCHKPPQLGNHHLVSIPERVTRVVDNLTIARETAATIKGDMARGEFEINRNGKKQALR